jgi:hypothetical protein
MIIAAVLLDIARLHAWLHLCLEGRDIPEPNMADAGEAKRKAMAACQEMQDLSVASVNPIFRC